VSHTVILSDPGPRVVIIRDPGPQDPP
jgi:hypothetical protein